MERIIIGDVIYSLRYIFFSSVVRIVDLIIFFLSFFGSFFFFFFLPPPPFYSKTTPSYPSFVCINVDETAFTFLCARALGTVFYVLNKFQRKQVKREVRLERETSVKFNRSSVTQASRQLGFLRTYGDMQEESYVKKCLCVCVFMYEQRHTRGHKRLEKEERRSVRVGGVIL